MESWAQERPAAPRGSQVSVPPYFLLETLPWIMFPGNRSWDGDLCEENLLGSVLGNNMYKEASEAGLGKS